HAFFVGFVFAMIFGHAPIIFPAVLRAPIRYHPVLYLPLALLHLALVARIAGDLVPHPAMRKWGGTGNVVAILLFAGSLILASVIGRPRRQGLQPRPAASANAASDEGGISL